MPEGTTQSVLIVGGDSGIGRAVAGRLLCRGLGIHLHARKSERLERTGIELTQPGLHFTR